MKLKISLILTLWISWHLQVIGQNTELVNITDLTKIVSTDNHILTKNGDEVLYLKKYIMSESENQYAYKSQLWISDLTGNDSGRALSSSEYNISSFELSPDGENIAFVRAKDGKSQVWVLPLKGGESQVVTSEKYNVSNPVWSPDGSKILYSTTLPIWSIEGTPDWEMQRPGREYGDEPNYNAINEGLSKEEISPNPDGSLEELRAFLAKNASKNDPRVIDRLNFLGETDLNPDLYFSHLNVLELKSKKTEQITNGFQSFFGACWSPDGKYILASSLSNTEHPDLTNHTEIWKINLEENKSEVFFSLENHRVGNPVFSPDGKWIAFGGQNMEEPSYNMAMIGIIRPDASDFKWITQELDRSVSGLKWIDDSKNLLFTGANQGGFSLWKANINTSKIEPLISGPVGVTGFDTQGQKLVYALTKVENPSEIYSTNLSNSNPKQVTKFNESWLAGKRISKPQAHQMVTEDGFSIDYWVMAPVDYEPGKKYPTILNMHGGPSAMWGPGEFSMWYEFQVMTAKGYGLVYANPRGSGGYGKAFQKGNFQNWGDGPGADVLGALDKAQEKYAWIDKDQLFLTGGSYAGYLTAWIVAHDHRFKAAFAQRGVYELTFFMGEGNAWRLVPNHFGYPWENGIKEILDYNSPQTYVQNIQTPLLIKHGDLDLRTGVRQSELLYKSLKILGKPVEYIRYPGEGHELSRSGAVHRRIDRMGRIIEFFERYAKHSN